jgi:deltex-like protein
LKYGISVISEQSKNTSQKAGSRDDKCPICLCDFTDKKTLNKCGHSFCAGCIDKAFKHQKKCPICSQVYGPLIGNQPPGQMTYHIPPGIGSSDAIIIFYRFPNGRQDSDHPNPGRRYQGTDQTAYLPNNQEGKKILMLLKKAFEQKLTFRIRPSTTTGGDDCVVWNDIPHKTSIYISARYVFVSLNDNLFVWTNLNKYALLHSSSIILYYIRETDVLSVLVN